jgi:hypothetical protein
VQQRTASSSYDSLLRSTASNLSTFRLARGYEQIPSLFPIDQTIYDTTDAHHDGGEGENEPGGTHNTSPVHSLPSAPNSPGFTPASLVDYANAMSIKNEIEKVGSRMADIAKMQQTINNSANKPISSSLLLPLKARMLNKA